MHAQQVFRSGVYVTTIDVTVIARNGDPVRDLKVEDFTVTVDGKPRAIVSAQFIGEPESPAAGAAAAPTSPAVEPDVSSNAGRAGVRGRLIVLLVDEGNIRMGAEKSVLKAAGGFLDRLLPTDRVALLTIPKGPTVAFTGDRERIKKAMHGIVGEYRLPIIRHNIAATEALLIEDGDADTLRKVVERECSKADAGCPYEIEIEARGMAPQVRVPGLDTQRALADAFKFLATIEGPKTVVMISEGLILDQQRFPSGLPPEVEQSAARSRSTVFVLRLDQSDSDVADAKPFRAADIRAMTIGLETVAGATGGEIMTVVGNGEGVFDRLTRELSGQYLLGIETRDSDRDGKTHTIKVGVRRGRVDVRSRRAFGADAAPARPGDASVSAVIMSALHSPVLQMSLPIRASSYTLLDADKSKVRVVLAAEIGENVTQPEKLALGYELVDVGGTVVGGHAGPVTLTPDGSGRLRFRQELSVAPGAYTFKLAAADAAGKVGSVDRAVGAELAKAGPVSIADLRVSDERGSDLDVQPSVSGRLSCAVDMRTLPGALPANTSVRLEIVDGAGKAAASGSASVTSSEDGVRHIARGVVDASALPAGLYTARAVVHAPGQPDGAVTRAFRIVR